MTVLHTHPGVAERFIKDIDELSKEILENPPKDAGGSVSNCVLFCGCVCDFFFFLECTKKRIGCACISLPKVIFLEEGIVKLMETFKRWVYVAACQQK